jgi:hypothetical protein
VISSTGLQERLVRATTSSDDANHSAIRGRNDLLGSGWQTHTSLLGVRIVSNDDGVVA